MTRRRYPLPLAVLACAALLAGCGSSNSSKSSSTGGSTPAGQTGSTSSGAPGLTTPSQIKAATEECKRIIQSQAKLPASAKEKLEGACAKAAKGDTAAVKQAAREVCEEVINKSQVPAGSAKQAALAACRK
jgi:hypothetical protein